MRCLGRRQNTTSDRIHEAGTPYLPGAPLYLPWESLGLHFHYHFYTLGVQRARYTLLYPL
jgi:hypothetical protein